MSQLELRGAFGLVDLAGDDAADVGERELDSQGDGAFSVGCAIAGEPGYVAAGADEAGRGD